VGEEGKLLEIKAHVVVGDSSSLRAISKASESARIKVSGFVFKPVASGMAVLRRHEIEKGVIVADIGANITDVAVFTQGSIGASFSVPVGSYHISNDLAVSLGTSFHDADELKKRYGHAVPKAINDGEMVPLKRHGESAPIQVKRRLVSGLIKDRLEELFSMIARVLEQEGLSVKQPAGIVLTGGGAKLPGIADLAGTYMSIPARIGFPHAFANDRPVTDTTYASGIGALLWFTNHDLGITDSNGNAGSAQSDLGKRFKVWLRDLLPA
jgi:cell division protein FtsA